MKNKEHIVSSEDIYRGKIINLKVDTVELPNKSYSKREIIEHDGSVGIIAKNREDKLILIKQYRIAADDELIEIPAGKIEAGEEPIDTAIREFKEETGYLADNLNHLLSFYSSAGYSSEIIHLFYAEANEYCGQDLEKNEFIEVIELSLEESYNMILNGQILDAKTIIAIQCLILKLDPNDC